jgi:hypothetical protein
MPAKRRDNSPRRSEGRPRDRHIVTGKGTTLPKWLREEVTRVTRKDRLDETLYLLEAGTDAFAAGRYGKAHSVLLKTKQLSPRAVAIRELLGLSAYRAGMWKEALAELRTYRRLTGDTIHMPVEMDVLRALDRGEDVRKVWAELGNLGGRPETLKEGRVVYASFLIDEGDLRGAWDVINPKRLSATPFEEDLRQWFVAARTAALLGDRETATKLVKAVEQHDPSMPGLDELRASIAGGKS